MEMKQLEKLLNEFEKFPEVVSNTTFMEICRHSKSRFEEICSRVLAFYLQPSNEHGLSDLLLKSLIQTLGKDYTIGWNETIFVDTEVYVDGKSLDILVRGDTFVLGIENKINAEVYNPLDIYGKLINQYNENRYKVVLSMRNIHKEYELINIKSNGFIIVYYEDFFSIVKNNIGNYYPNANQKYITYLFDFITTIENMSKNTTINDPQSVFFFDNAERLENLVSQFNQHKGRVLEIQKRNILVNKELISEKAEVDWWIYQGWDLGYNNFIVDGHKIGIEASYTTQDYDPLKLFKIYITTWNLEDWNFYKEDVLKKYPETEYYLDTKSGGRAYLHMSVIENNDTEKIVLKLSEYYTFLKELVTRIKV